MINPTQRPLPDNTQQSKETDIYVPGGIRTLITSKRAAADPTNALDRLVTTIGTDYIIIYCMARFIHFIMCVCI